MAINPDALNPIIDGDIICYRVGFAAENEPLHFCLSTVRNCMENILAKFPQRDYYSLYLNGSGNFRHNVATIKEYKGNRKDAKKPKYFDEIREYLVHVWDAQVVDGRETDDALGCEQLAAPKKTTVIVTIDKDLKMIPGFNYNWVKDELIYINKTEAALHFYRQMLQGDTVDNIPGIKGVGPKTIDKLLAEAEYDPIKMQKIVKDLYVKQYGDQADAAYHEVGTLLWMQRKEGDNYTDYGL